jgi:hypothetical protein
VLIFLLQSVLFQPLVSLFLRYKIQTMRKQLLFVSLVAFAGTASAQVTITDLDQPQIMEVFQQATDTMGTQNEGASGPSITYNMSTLLNQGQDSLTFTNAQWTPYDTSYPGANISIVLNTGDAYTYVMMNNSVLEVHGQAADPFGNGVIPLTFTNPETQMIFPAAYGSSFADTAGGVNQFYLGYDPGIGFTIDSVIIHTTITKNSDFDGWGSLTSPLGTFNVLRQNTYRKQVDTIDIYAFGSWTYEAFTQVDSLRNYTYWANGIGFPVVELTDQDDQGSITDATWLVSMPAVTGIPTNETQTIVAYPNPVSDVFTVETSVEEGTIEIIDMTGRVVKTQMITSKTTRMNMTDLASGMYTYRVVGVNQQGKVQVAH